MKRSLYSLSHEWLAYCKALTVQVLDVQELAAQGSVVEAYRRLSERLAGTGTGASHAARPQAEPFVRVAPVATSGQAVGQQTAKLLAAVAASSQSAASGAPTAGLEGAAGAAALRALPVSQVRKSRRFRPLIRSRLLLVPSFNAPRISIQIFVLKPVWGGPSNATA